MANKIYVARETGIKWNDAGGDLVMTLRNLGAGVGRIGALKDWGAGSTSEWFTWRLTVQFETAPVVGEVVEVYLSWSDGSQPDGEQGVGDAAAAEDSLKNMKFIGALVVTSTDTAHDMTVSGVCRISTRYVMPVIFNNTADNLEDQEDVSEFVLTPIPPEIQ